MKKIFMAVILLAFVDLGFLFAQGTLHSPVTWSAKRNPRSFPAVQGATITGTVVDARTRQPLRGAIVTAPRAPTGKPDAPAAIGFRTGEDGKFILRGVAPGIVNFSVFKAGYASGPLTSVRPASDGEQIDNVILTVPFGATLSGQVSDESGQPVVGTQVAVRANQPAGAGPAQPMLRGATTTAEDGRYAIGGLAAGDYTILVGSLDDTAEIISSGGATSLNLPGDSASSVQAKPVTLSAGEVRDDVDLVIRFGDRFVGPRPLDYGTATIQGRVVDDSGIGIAQARVLLRQDTKGGGTVVTRTNASGHFRFERVPDGQFVIGLARAGMPVLDGVGQSITVQTAGPRNENVLITSRRGGTISGTVTDEFGDPALASVIVSSPIRAAEVPSSDYMASVAVQMPGAVVGTDVHGRYRIARLPAGEYVVSAIARDLPTARAEVHFTDETGRDRILPPGPTFYPGVPTVAQATRIAVRENGESIGVDLTVRPLLMTSIGVTLTASRPIGEVQLHLVHDDALPMLERTVRTSDRTVTLDARPGRYRLVASAEAPASADPIVRLWSTADVYADLANPASVTMTLEPGANLSGRIAFDGKESNRQNAGAWLLPTEPLFPLRSSTTTGNAMFEPATGRFTMEGVMPARYMLYAGGAERGRSTWMLKSATINGRDVLDEPIDLHAGDDIIDVRMTVTDRVTEVSGTVLDAAGKPAAVAGWVVAFSTEKKHWWPGSRRLRAVRPGPNGTYTIRALPPGQYAVAILPETIGEAELIAKLPALVTDGVRVSLAEGERRMQELRAPGK